VSPAKSLLPGVAQLHTAEMMARQPPALLVTAADDEWDARFKTDWCSLRLLSMVYARRLTAAGVSATHRHYVGPGKQRRPHCFMCNDYVGRSLWCASDEWDPFSSSPACRAHDVRRHQAQVQGRVSARLWQHRCLGILRQSWQRGRW
jgi:hypothetical protein